MSSEANPLARHGGLSYLEIPVLDPRQSAVFYEEVLGWQIEERGNGEFRFSDRDGFLIGRWVIGRAASREPGVLPFIYVEDIDAAFTRARENGGEIIKAPYAEGDVTVATIRDPAGNVVGLWQFA
jgi:predicted enzyme related to lactoylglutathione lyase